jgi:hypothetical protein
MGQTRTHPSRSGVDGRAREPMAVELDRRLAGATADLATALGLIRVLTLLPLYDASLGEIEARLARSVEHLRDARRLIGDESRTGRHLRLAPDPNEQS